MSMLEKTIDVIPQEQPQNDDFYDATKYMQTLVEQVVSEGFDDGGFWELRDLVESVLGFHCYPHEFGGGVCEAVGFLADLWCADIKDAEDLDGDFSDMLDELEFCIKSNNLFEHTRENWLDVDEDAYDNYRMRGYR